MFFSALSTDAIGISFLGHSGPAALNARINKDGTFRAEECACGNYQLLVGARQTICVTTLRNQ